jgi:hypothetical protein
LALALATFCLPQSDALLFARRHEEAFLPGIAKNTLTLYLLAEALE